MPKTSLSARLAAGKASYYLYHTEALAGLVSVWKHEDRIVLTWEECPPGEQYDESRYTRDERYVFRSDTELLAFLSDHGLRPEEFSA